MPINKKSIGGSGCDCGGAPPPCPPCGSDECRPVVGRATLNTPDCVFGPGLNPNAIETACSLMPWAMQAALPGDEVFITTPCYYYGAFPGQLQGGIWTQSLFQLGSAATNSQVEDVVNLGLYKDTPPGYPNCTDASGPWALDEADPPEPNPCECEQVTYSKDLGLEPCPKAFENCTGAKIDSNEILGTNLAADYIVYDFRVAPVYDMHYDASLLLWNVFMGTWNGFDTAWQLTFEGAELVARLIFVDPVFDGAFSNYFVRGWHAWSVGWDESCGAKTLSPDIPRSESDPTGAQHPNVDVFVELLA